MIALARALAGLTLAILTGPALPSARLPTAAGAAPAADHLVTARPADAAAISTWHLFGQAEASRPVAAAPAPAPVTPLNLRLVGVFFMERGGDRALALIADGNGPERAAMVGNSLKSDVVPALEAGAWGIHVPHDLTWALERVAAPEGAPRYRSIVDLSALPGLIAGLDAQG